MTFQVLISEPARFELLSQLSYFDIYDTDSFFLRTVPP